MSSRQLGARYPKALRDKVREVVGVGGGCERVAEEVTKTFVETRRPLALKSSFQAHNIYWFAKSSSNVNIYDRYRSLVPPPYKYNK